MADGERRNSMTAYSDEDVRVIAGFLYECASHGLLDRMIRNPADKFAIKAKMGGFNDCSDDEYRKKLAKVKQKTLLWDNRQEASPLYILNNIARQCPEDDAVALIGCLVKQMADLSWWTVDAGIFHYDLFGEE